MAVMHAWLKESTPLDPREPALAGFVTKRKPREPALARLHRN
jgi:hypothetical protein